MPAATSAEPPASPSPRTGEIRDTGVVRREAVRAHHWICQGAVKVLGDVDVDRAELGGLVTVRGSVTGGDITVQGTLEVGGTVALTGGLRTDGEIDVTGAAHAGSIGTTGAARFRGGLSAVQDLRSAGSLEVHGQLQSPKVEFTGRIEVDDELTATELMGTLRGDSRLATVRADRVVLRRGSRLAHAHLKVLTIEAKEVALEQVEAEYVRADRIALGPGCQIARVEGTVTEQHASAHVGPVSRTPRPYGLTR